MKGKNGRVILLLVAVFFFHLSRGQESSPSGSPSVVLDGEKSLWHEGFERYDYIMDENTLVIKPYRSPEGEGFGIQDPPHGFRRCVLVAPRQAAAGNPWSWRGCYWDHQPQTEVELLRRGFYIAYISASATLRPGKEWDAWYKFLTVEKGLSRKPAFIGMSRGGEFGYTWATAHPDEVSCIYADNPYVPFEVLTKVGELARRDVPLFHVCGSIDPLLVGSTLPIENMYRQFGGRISVMIKEGFGHHPHSLHNPKVIADFIQQSVSEKKEEAPPYAGVHAVSNWYYGVKETYKYFPEEAANISFRGPFFDGCYNRYTVQIPGVDAFTTIIAPGQAAVGRPWIFRSDYVRPDDVLTQELLAKGYTIVTGAVPYNYDGPVADQWNTIYTYLTGYGLSKKPLMAGHGGAAGEAIAWAIRNPGKVAGVYAENPILKSKGILPKGSLSDSLGPLVKEGVPLLFICGGEDSSSINGAMAAARRYLVSGGRIRVLVRKGEGHLLSPGDPKAAVDFIRKCTTAGGIR